MKNLLISFFVIISITSYGQLQHDKLTVVGKAVVSEIPENIFINLNLFSKSDEYNKCHDELIKKSNLINTILLESGIVKQEIVIDRLSIRKRENNNYKIEKIVIDYHGNVNINVEIKYEKNTLNKLISVFKSEKLGYSVGFSLSKEQKKRLADLAVEKAVEDAKHKSNLMAKSLNVTLVKIHDVKYDYRTNIHDVLIFDEEEEDVYNFRVVNKNIGSIELIPKQLEVVKNIIIEWIINNES